MLVSMGLMGIGGKEKISQDEFMKIMGGIFKEATKDIDNLASKVKIFAEQVKRQQIPQFLQPGNLFLGRYLIH